MAHSDSRHVLCRHPGCTKKIDRRTKRRVCSEHACKGYCMCRHCSSQVLLPVRERVGVRVHEVVTVPSASGTVKGDVIARVSLSAEPW